MTTLPDLTLRVFPGPGFVSRFPGVCLVVVPTTRGQHAFVGELIGLLDRDEPGQRHELVRHIAGAIANADPADIPRSAQCASLKQTLCYFYEVRSTRSCPDPMAASDSREPVPSRGPNVFLKRLCSELTSLRIRRSSTIPRISSIFVWVSCPAEASD